MDRKRAPKRASRSGEVRPASKEFLRYIDEQAAEIRRCAGVTPLEQLDPWAVSEQLGLTIVTPEDVVAMTPEHRSRVRQVTPKQWSGTGMKLPDNCLLVMLNSEQTHERAAVTIMEERAHAHYGHQPTQIVTLPSGVTKRTFNPRNEQEAYWTAAAALLPTKAVGKAVWRGQTIAELATTYGVSIELVEFRIKILGLWSYYITHKA